MRHSLGLQISDLEAISSFFEQEITIEEAAKVVGGGCQSAFDSLCLRTEIIPGEGNIIPIDNIIPTLTHINVNLFRNQV